MAPSRFLGLTILLGMSLTVMHQTHACANVRTHEVRKDKCVMVPAQDMHASAVVTLGGGIDHLFVCTGSVPSIYVNAPIPYAAAKNVFVAAPAQAVAALCNSPPGRHY